MATTTKQNLVIPDTLRWTPMPAPYAESMSTLLPVTMKPDFPAPCRRCLQDSNPGDEMVLVSYDPFVGNSPYRCASPIFLHTKPCELASPRVLPEQQRSRLLSVRAYDANHMMRGNEVVPGDKVLETCERLLAEDGPGEYCHVHNAAAGCFAVRVDKAQK
ncbi:hypothetical protein F4777DRAFT_538086 [Nemania sp. FL0916]|nr:hypothetical protein F4777DRAFT_538086 [Nemania sp. FL0916]